MTDSPFRLPDHPAADDSSDETSDATESTIVSSDAPPASESDVPEPPATVPEPPPWWRADPTGTGTPPSEEQVRSEPASELPPTVPAPAPRMFEPAPAEPAPADSAPASAPEPTEQPDGIVEAALTPPPTALPTETFRPVAPITAAPPLTPVPRAGGPRAAPPRSRLAPPPRSSIPLSAPVPRLGGGGSVRHGRDLPRRGRAAAALLSVSIVMGLLVGVAVTLILFLAGAALQRALG